MVNRRSNCRNANSNSSCSVRQRRENERDRETSRLSLTHEAVKCTEPHHHSFNYVLQIYWACVGMCGCVCMLLGMCGHLWMCWHDWACVDMCGHGCVFVSYWACVEKPCPGVAHGFWWRSREIYISKRFTGFNASNNRNRLPCLVELARIQAALTALPQPRFFITHDNTLIHIHMHTHTISQTILVVDQTPNLSSTPLP